MSAQCGNVCAMETTTTTATIPAELLNLTPDELVSLTGPHMDLVCIGFNTPAHLVAEDMPYAYCAACTKAADAEVRAHRERAAQATEWRRECRAGGHPEGSRWSTCIGCYRD